MRLERRAASGDGGGEARPRSPALPKAWGETGPEMWIPEDRFLKAGEEGFMPGMCRGYARYVSWHVHETNGRSASGDRLHPLALYHPLAVLVDDLVELERGAEVPLVVAAADPDLAVLAPVEVVDAEEEVLS